MNPADPRGDNLPHGAHGGAGARHHGHHQHHPQAASASMMLPRLVGGLRCLDVIREMEEHLVIERPAPLPPHRQVEVRLVPLQGSR